MALMPVAEALARVLAEAGPLPAEATPLAEACDPAAAYDPGAPAPVPAGVAAAGLAEPVR